MDRIATLVLACGLLAGVATAAPGPVRFDEAKGLTEPVIVEKVAPVYPPEARAERVQGTVVMDTTIDTEGRVTDARVVKQADPRLDKAAKDAVLQWTYKPARDKKGNPVSVVYTVTVRFALH